VPKQSLLQKRKVQRWEAIPQQLAWQTWDVSIMLPDWHQLSDIVTALFEPRHAKRNGGITFEIRSTGGSIVTSFWKTSNFSVFTFWIHVNTSRAGVRYIRTSISAKTSSCRLPYQRPSFSADCARELFKGSNGLYNLLHCTRKKIFWLGATDFLWVTS